MAPTFVAEYEVSAWDTTTSPRTVSVTTAVNDVLVAFGVAVGTTLNTPTGGTGLTWTLNRSLTSSPALYIWTATATTAETFTLSVSSASGFNIFGFNCLRFGSGASIGASEITSGSSSGPSLAVTTQAANSAIVVATVFDGGTGSAPTYRTGAGTFTQQTSAGPPFTFWVYGGYHADAGVAGAKTVGQTAPTGTWKTTAVEVKESGGGGGAFNPARFMAFFE